MIRNRIACAAALLIAFAFYIFYVDYFSYYLLIYMLSIIALSALMLIPCALSLKSRLEPRGAKTLRGSAFTLEWALENRLRLPLIFVGTRLQFKNLLTGELENEAVRLAVPPRGKRLIMTHTPRHCGLIRCELKRVRVYDMLGIFAIGLKAADEVNILALPPEAPLRGEIDLSVPSNSRIGKRANQSNPYASYDIREYRPGDSPRDMHWKASAKLDGLFVKEVSELTPSRIMLLADLNLSPEQIDGALACVMAFSKQLIQRRMPFDLVYADTLKDKVVEHVIEAEADLMRALRDMLKTPVQKNAAPLEGRVGELSCVRAFAAQPEGLLDINKRMYIYEAGEL